MKSFLGLFGGKDDGEPGKAETPREKRRENRLDVREEPPLLFYLRLEGGGATSPVQTSVVNVSARGLRLKMSAEVRGGLQVGQDLGGELEIEKSRIPLTLRLVRFIGTEEAGFRIRPPFPKELDRLEKYLEPRFLGLSIREIDPDKLQRETVDTGDLRWFQGLNETNLFSWTEGAGIVHQQLVFLERVVEWIGAEPVKTGRIRGEAPGIAGWVKAELLEFDLRPDAELLAQARVLLDNASIDAKVKTVFQEKMTHVG